MLGVSPDKVIKTFQYFEDFAENQKKNEKFLGYLRFIVYDGNLNNLLQYFDPAIGDLYTCRDIRRKLRMPEVSINNERKMLERLKDIAETYLSQYPQTYEEDLVLLKDENLTFNQRNCITFRAEEKNVI